MYQQIIEHFTKDVKIHLRMRAFKRKFIHVIFKSGRLENMYVIQKEYISGNVLKKRIATSNVKPANKKSRLN